MAVTVPARTPGDAASHTDGIRSFEDRSVVVRNGSATIRDGSTAKPRV